MRVWALIPVKPFQEGKSRLAQILRPEERERLNRRLLARVLDAVQAVEDIQDIWVLSRDPAVLAFARTRGVRTWQEAKNLSLNETLTRAVTMLAPHGLRCALILPADLPLITPEDVQALLEPLTAPEAEAGIVAIAPDRHHQGTNGLALCPPEGLTFSFGAGSFWAHIRTARELGRYVAVVDRPGLATDLDTPEDWHWLIRIAPEWQTLKWEASHEPIR